TTVYIRKETGEQVPYVVKEVSPLVEGVSVVAEGGGNAVVQKNITEVIQALFGIEVHKIKVVKMK
ncbi:MAG: stage III sporulation protein AG, partial [Lachnospiraceae bacterium]